MRFPNRDARQASEDEWISTRQSMAMSGSNVADTLQYFSWLLATTRLLRLIVGVSSWWSARLSSIDRIGIEGLELRENGRKSRRILFIALIEFLLKPVHSELGLFESVISPAHLIKYWASSHVMASPTTKMAFEGTPCSDSVDIKAVDAVEVIEVVNDFIDCIYCVTLRAERA